MESYVDWGGHETTSQLAFKEDRRAITSSPRVEANLCKVVSLERTDPTMRGHAGRISVRGRDSTK